MLCGKTPVKSGSGSTAAVYLNVYDLTSINGYAYWLGLGVFHSGLEVHGVEYAFGAHEFPTTGIFEGEPKQCEGFTFRKSILIGWTDMNGAQVKRLMEKLAERYRGNAYNLVAKNCNHFCDDACIQLTGNPIPNWVNRLARIGFLCKCIIPVNLNSTKVAHGKVQDNNCEDVKKKLKSCSKSSSNTTSSSCSPPTSADADTNGKSSLLASDANTESKSSLLASDAKSSVLAS